MIDLPAPVSPVSTVSPGCNSSSTESMIAKSRICRCVSMGLPGVIGPAAAPVKLGAQQDEGVVAGRMRQRDAFYRNGDPQRIGRVDLAEHVAVADDLRASIRAFQQS